MARIITLLVIGALVAGCQGKSEKQPLIKLENKAEAEQPGESTVLVTGLADQAALERQAEAKGLQVERGAVMTITGPTEAIEELEVDATENYFAIEDDRVVILPDEDPIQPDPQIFYLAKRDFGLPTYWQQNPEHDGRGVTVGVIDDGVSPILDGLQTTSDGKRKYLRHTSNSTMFELQLAEVAGDVQPSPFLSTTSLTSYSKAWQGSLDEARPTVYKKLVDINLNDASTDKIAIAVFEVGGSVLICVDANVNDTIDADGECFGDFSESGEHGFWTVDKLNAIQAEFDTSTATIRVRPGENPKDYDGHGEGVASVMVGHGIGGQYDGVAPGAQMLDYDLSEKTDKFEEDAYTIGTFIKALEWMGQNGAEVCNISYSLFFSTAHSQSFMKNALAQVIDKYNMVISFSAGNNGPGLGSFNRGLIYPSSALVAGAFVSKDLDEYVHGVTGLPDPGRVVYYSSRGPSPDGGTSPVVISPLASMTHDSPQGGFGAFSGTSSASPALAGLATVMISAVKANGWPVEAAAISAAIQMSGVRLAGIPYIDQGAGLPKIDRALAAYQQIIGGVEALQVISRVTGDGPDGVTKRGIVLRTSQVDTAVETSIRSYLQFAAAVPAGDVANKLIPVNVTYSAPWVQGASKTFLSKTDSGIYVKVDIPALLAGATTPGLDHAAEIQFTNANTGALIKTIPVTVIDDVKLEGKLRFEAELEPEQGKRFHFYVPEGTQAVVLKPEDLTQNGAVVGVIMHDTNFVKTYRGFRKDGQTILVETPKAGWYQVALARSKGAALNAKYAVTVQPLKLKLKTSLLETGEESIEIENLAGPMDLKFQIRPKGTNIARMGANAAVDGDFSFEFTPEKAGMYLVNFENPSDPDVSYNVINCDVWLLQGDKEKRLTTAWGSGSFFLYDSDLSTDAAQVTVTTTCLSFEYSTLTTGGVLPWVMDVNYLNEADLEKGREAFAHLNRGHNAIKIEAADFTPGGELEVTVTAPFEDRSSTVTIGTILSL